ncbi:SdrD B-like domain-containing protein [Lacihabitans soyangensis]|uniref:DUF11 domain-containing protein n=1 Tax=Lacihabitans soyangensis TaxID=869394 RepID=A0AAE3H7I9_9BACT|nr:SdrD B-like domain-containing protein [Lacihabitans soyangensis]MCP9766263.1 DUF11 domain-containing protein [Lacihabitans soyangensis]
MRNIYFIILTCLLININFKSFSQSTVGNYVWEDINANGIQDEPASSGMNNVTVEIYQPIGSIPDPSSDTFVGFEITANDGLGNPGYFQFTGLANGNYYVVFRNPGGDFLVAPKSNPSTTNIFDSDGNSALIGVEKVGITEIFTFSSSTTNLNFDQGFHHPCYTPITASATSDSPVCFNSSLNLVGTSVGGTIFSWTGPNGFTSNLQNPSIANTTLANGGIYTLTVTDGTACSATATTAVIINPPVETPIFGLGTSSTRCQGAGTVTYSATSVNSTVIVYSLDATSLTAGNIINSTTGEVTFVAGWSGTSSITATASGCNGPTLAIHTVTTTASVGLPIFASGSASVRCQGAGPVTYTATASNSTSIVYSLNTSSTNAGNTINAATGEVTYVAGWSGTSTIRAQAFGCNGPVSANHVVTITPTVGTPIFSLGGTSTRCQGVETLVYTATATNSTGITYSLDATSLSAGNTINAATGNVTYTIGYAGTSTITASASGCNGPVVASHTVTITPSVATPAFGLGATSMRCQSAGNVTYTATAANSTGLTYSLDAASLTGGNTINSSTGEVSYLAGWTGTSIITVSATGCNGPSSANHTVTTTNSVGTPFFSLGATSIRCQGANAVTYLATATNSTGITYTLDGASLTGGNTINASTGQVNYVIGWTGTSTITATATGCNGPNISTHTVTITPSVTIPVFTSGTTSVRCQALGSITYTASASNSTSITYSLDATSISGGNTINISTGEVTFTAAWSGTSIITATAAGCNGPNTATHTVTTTPTVGTPIFSLGSSSIRCQGAESVSYDATASNSTGITYSLDAESITTGNTINATSGQVTYLAGWSGTSIITATATGCNGPSSATHTVTINGNVTTPVFGLGATSVRCQGIGIVTYSAAATNAVSIVYSLNAASLTAGNTINSSTGAVTFTAGWTGTSTITATANGCNGPTTASHVVTINPTVGTPIFALGATSIRCQGAANITYTATATNSTGVTYTLDASSLSGGNTINSLTGEVTFVPSWTGTSIITVSATGCNGPSTASHTVTTTNSVGTPIFSLGATSVRCQGANAVTYFATATTSTGITYTLDGASLTAGNTINASTGQVNFVIGWTGTSTITATATGCNGPSVSSHVVTITPSVTTPVFASGATSVRCQGAGNLNYSATASNTTGITYSLNAASITGGNTINASTGEVTFAAGWSGTTTITASAAGCNGPRTATHTVTITPTVGTPVFSLGATSVRCQAANNVTYTASASNSTGITYSLDPASITGGNTINTATGQVTFVAGWFGTSVITASAAGCNGPSSASHTVTINSTVATPVFSLGTSSTRCQGAGVVTYSATAANATGIVYSLNAASLSAGNTINSSTGAVTFTAGWTGNSTITATASGCNGPSTASHVVTITPTVGPPSFTLGATSSRCQGAAIVSYSATSTNSTGITYTLDANSLSGGNTINATTGEVTYNANWSGTSIITASAAGCNGPRTANHTVTITASVGTPIFTLGISSTRCQGNGSVIYTATASNSISITYTLDAISLGAGNTINASNGRVNYVNGWVGDVTITATATGCNSTAQATHTSSSTASITTPVFASGSSSIRCQNAGTVNYSATSNNSTSIVYSLNAASLSGGNTINSATGDVTYTAGWTGTSTITATAFGCNGPLSSTHTVTITPSVGTPVFALGLTSNRCQSANSVTYTATASNNTGITYSLDVNSILAGNTINATTGEITYGSTWFGTSQITATASGCNGPRSTTHTVTTTRPVETPIFTLGSSSVRCQGAGTLNYGATALYSTAITYTLDVISLGAGNTINSTTGNVTFTNGWSGTSTVTASAVGCFGPLTATHVITTTPTVGNPVFALGSSSNRCIGAANVTYSATATNNTGISYSLDNTSLTAGNTVNSATGEVSFDPAWFGVSTITVTVTGCNGPKTATHTVTTAQAVLMPVFASGASSVRCQGAGNTLYGATAANTTGIVYTLDAISLSGGNTINASTGNVTFVAGWTGISTVTATASGCYGPTQQTHVITTTPSVTTPVFDLGATSTRCQGAGVVTYNATASYQTSLTYTLDGISLAGGNSIDANTGAVTFAPGWNGTSRVTAIVTGCSGPKSTIHTITVTPTVGFPIFTLGANSVRCQTASTIIYNATSTNSTGITYALDATSLSFGNAINPSTGAITFLASWTGTSVITATATGCNGPRATSHTISTIYLEATDDNGTGLQGTPLIIPVLNNDLGDKDPTKVSIVTPPSHGFIQIGTNGEITYLPNGNFYGLDQFTYSVCSTGSSFCCSQATVYVQIDESLNDPCSEATKSKIYFLPFAENTSLLRKALWSAGSISNLSDSARTVLSIKIPYPGNIITYDHWEDGYETDITIPSQGTTEVWGDGIIGNGWAPGYPTDIIPAGGYILIDNHFRYNPRNSAQIVFDGRDKILSSNDIAISKISGDAGFAGGSFNFDVQSLKTNVFDNTRFGKFFVIPFGEDNVLGGTAAFKYTGIFVKASKNGTIVNLDYNADGLVDISSPVMNEGDVIYYDGTASTPGIATDINNANDIKSGAILTANHDFGVDVVFGGIDSYGTRNMALLPGNFYGDVYYSPAHTTLSTAPVYAFFTNNLSTSIIIDWTSGNNTTGSITIPGKSDGFLSLNSTAAYKFKSRNGEAYTAVAVFDADNDGSAYDWSFNMIPENRLSTFASVAWAPGSSNGTGNYNPVWVTAPTATTIYIKYDGRLSNTSSTTSPCGMAYDIAVPIAALQSYKILDPDNDQTGLAVFTCDGTKIAAIWGQDPNGTPPGSPGMDVGYIMEPRCLQQLIIANDDITDTEPNTPVIIEIQNNDYGFLCTPNPSSVSTLGLLQPTNGTVVINPDGTVTYRPNNGFQGTDTFEYRLCSVEYPGICDIALVKVRVSTCIANSNENLFRGKVFAEALPDDGTYNGEMGAVGVSVDLYIDANCNGVIDPGEGITQTTVSDISGKYSFSTKDGNNARDDFDPTAGFSGNDGGLNWNTNWVEVGDNNVFSSGDIQIIPDPSSSGMGNAIRLSGANNEINRSLAFNNTLNATLKFSYKRQGLERQGEGVNIVLNGTTIFALNDGLAVGTDLNYTNVYLPITAYNANGVNTLKFITNGSVSSDDFFWIDNIELSFYKNPPICYIAKVNTSNTNGNYLPSSLNTQTAIFNVLGVCDKDNNLGVLPQLIASNDNSFTSIDQSVDINILRNDIIGKPDTASVSFVGVTVSPTNGTVAINSDGTIKYTPNPTFTGTDQFEYRVCSLEDPTLCDIALVNVTVSCASSPLINEISGTVHIDSNNDGTFGIGENGLDNISVNLISDLNKNGIIDSGEPIVDTELTDINGYYSFVINPQTTPLNYLDQFNFSTTANQSNGSTNWTTSWIKIGDTGTFGQNNIQISNITGLRIQSNASLVSGAYRTLNIANAVSANLTLDFNEQNLDLQVNDFVDLQIANSASPSNWTLLKRFTGADGNQSGSQTFDISNFISATTTIRFVTSGSSLMIPGDLVYFDNIKVDYLQPAVASQYITQLAQPIPAGYSLTYPSPSPTGYRMSAFTAAGQGSCSNNFGLAVTDLAVTKIVNIPNPYVGDTIQFTVQARNFGPTNATNVVVTDVLPTGYELIGVTATTGTWVGSNWTVGNMLNGAIETLIISARVVAPGAYLNTANISGDQPEQNTSNNESSATTFPIPIIDLSLTNLVNNTSPNVGDVVTFTVDLTNADLSPATNVEIKTIVPNGYNNISNISNGGTLLGNTITWNLANISNNANRAITYQATVLAPFVGANYTTVAQVTAATEQDLDSTPNNNNALEDDQASASLTPLVADLSLTNQINNVLPTIGDVVTFTVRVQNEGPNTATNLSVANLVANGYSNINNISNGGTLNGNTIIWNLANLPMGANQSFTYQATVLTPGPGILFNNIAQVSAADQYDPDSSPNNNVSTEDDQSEVTATLQGSNLSLTKQINNAIPNVGEVVTFTITVHNAGPDLATNVAVEDIVPNGYLNLTNINNSGIKTGNTINWTGLSVANGSDLILSYQATVNAPIAGINYTNVAQITASDQFDPNSLPNNDNPSEDDQDQVTSVPKVANLNLLKQVNNLTPQVGDTVTFTVSLNNLGPNTANNIVIKDTIPNGYAGIMNISHSGILTGNILTWNISALNNGGGQIMTYQAVVQAPLIGTSFTNIAQITGVTEFDPNSTPNNNNSLEDDQSQVTTVPQVANLSITKQISNLYPLNGDVVTFSITVNNAGPVTATNISMLDVVPNGYSNITNISHTGNLTGNSINWTIPSLGNGSNIVLTYQATVEQSGVGISHRNVVEIVDVDQFDPNSTPNNHISTEDDQAEITATPQTADLVLTKQINDLTPNPGDLVTFSITVQNFGPNAATNILIQDVIPNGYSNISNVSNSGTFVGNNLEWTIFSLANGASQVLTYQAMVEAPTAGINFTNIAQVMAVDQFDPNSTPGNSVAGENDQSQVTAVPNVANLSITKTTSNTRPNVGDIITFTLTLHNSGPNAATNVSVEDITPNGYSNVANASHAGVITGNTVNWNNLTIANGAYLVLTYQVKVRPAFVGVNYTNTAQITGSDQYDPNSTPSNDNPTEDDQGSVTTNPRIANLSLTKTINNPNPIVGEVVTFTINLTNIGPDTARNVVIEDAIPNGFSNISNISNSGVFLNDTLNWNIASLAVGNNLNFTYQATVMAPVFGVNYTNIAQVKSVNEYDPNSTPDNDNPAEDDQDEETATVDNTVPTVVAGSDFTKTCLINTSGQQIGESPQANHSYSWSPSAGLSSSSISNPVANPTATTVYVVTKTNLANGFTATASVTVTVETTIPIANAGLDFVKTCVSNPSGALVGEVNDPSSSYLWTPVDGLSNSTISNPLANPSVSTVYYVTKTHLASGCTALDSVEVTVDTAPPTPAIAGNDTLTCALTAVTRTASGSISYAWSNGLGNSAIANISAPGTYTVTVTALNGCTATATTVVNQDITVPTVSIAGNDTLTCTLTAVTRTASGGVSYAWSSGLGNNATANISVPGTYIVSVTAANGCITNDTTVVIQNITSPTVSITGTDTLTCALTIVSRTASGGISYAWSNGLGNNATANISAPGTYFVAVTAANGCVTNDTTVVIQNNTTPTVSIAGNDTLTCALTIVSRTASGGVSYAWSNGLGNNTTANISAPGTYIVAVTAANGCVTNDTTIVIQNITAPTVSIAGTDTLTCALTSVTRTASGGVSYAWSNGLGNNATANISAQGTYTVTVTALNGCTATATTVVNQDITVPTVAIAGNDTLTCALTTVTRTASSGVSYVWSNGLGNNATANISAPGTYIVAVTAANGCVTNDTTIVSQNITAPTVSIAGTDTLTCALTTVTRTASGGVSYAWSNGLGNIASANISTPGTYFVAVTAANGCVTNDTTVVSQNITAPTVSIAGNDTLTCALTTVTRTASGGVSYAWSNGIGNSATANISAPGTYFVAVTAANGCVTNDTTVVSQNITAPTVSIAGNDTLTCALTAVTRTASGGVSYAWSNGLGNNGTANISTPGTYTVTVTTLNGCTATATTVVNQDITFPTVSIAGIDTLTCALTSVTRTASGGVSYAWSNGLGNNATANISAPGTYIVAVTAANGCVANDTTVVIQNITAPTVSIAGTDTLTCALTTVTRTASGGVSYAWSSGLGNNATANISAPGTYFVAVTAANGCATNDTTVVSQDGSLPTIAISGIDTLTCSVTSVSLTASGGVSYVWSNSLGTNPNVTISNPGTYTVAVTGANGCTSSQSFEIVQNIGLPVVNISGNDTISILKNSVLRIAHGGTSFAWSNSLGTNDSVSISSPGIYTVTATGVNGCTATATTEVIEVRFGSINGIAWVDNDYDGVQEITETHSANETVYLYTGTGNIMMDSTVTDINGAYRFDSLITGTYLVRFKIPNSAMVTPSNMAIDTLDSDFSLSAWSETISIDVSKSISDTLRTREHYDIGFANFGSISGKVFDDKDFNNIQSSGDLSLANIRIYLLDNANVRIDSTISDALGVYSFDSIIGGNYKIQFVKPIGTNASLKDIGSDDSKDSDADNISGMTDSIFINSSLPINNSGRDFSNIDAGFVNYDSKINLIKDGALVGKGLVGDFITYGFTVKNTGNTTLKNVFIIDSLISSNPIAVSPDSLIPGQTGFAVAQYILTANDVMNGKVMNSATVYGTDPLDSVVTDISDNVNPFQTGPSDSTEVILAKVDLSLRVNATSLCSAEINDIITYQVIVGRNDTLNVTDIISVKDSLGVHLQFVSANATSGTYNPSTHIWSNVALNNSGFDTLTIQARVMTNMGGQMPLTAWVLTGTYGDIDSTPGNKITTEDDYGSTFVSVPIKICPAKNESVTLTAPAGFGTYQWQLNGVDIVGATSSTYTATRGGNYTVIVNGNTCSTGNCCPIIVQENCDCKAEICLPFTITKTK